jgi:ribonuclease HI
VDGDSDSPSVEHETWIMYFNGSVMKGAGVGLVFISPLGVRIEYLVRLPFPTPNNTAENKALINSLRIAAELKIKRLEIRGDSELVVDQVMKDKNCMDPKMAAYCQAMRDLEDKFHGLELHHVLRDYNKEPTYSRRPHQSRPDASRSLHERSARSLCPLKRGEAPRGGRT